MTFMIMLLSFLFGIILGFLSIKLLILPLFHGLPKAVFYVAKRILKPVSILFYLGSFFLWVIIFAAAIFLVVKYLSNFIDQIYTPLVTGFCIGLLTAIIYASRPQTMQDLDSDFWDAMEKYRIK